MKKLIDRNSCKEIQLNILLEVSRVCTNNDLHYYLAYGSLLGAVRHEGYIPWDDDIDIYMARGEYEQLKKLLKNHKTDSCQWLEILDDTNEGYYYPFAKAVDIRTQAKMESNLTKHGIWVDIFPIDGLPKSNIGSWLYLSLCHFLRAIVLAMTTDFSSNKLGKKATYKKILGLFAGVFGEKKICYLYERLCRRYDLSKSKYGACLSSAYGYKDRMEKSILFDEAEYPFEGEKFKGPKAYDAYLSNLYGDYMKLPPEDERYIHSIIANWI